MTFKKFCKIIKDTRIDKNISQKDFSLALGLSQSHYCKIENGLQEPNFLYLTKIIKLLDIDFTAILANDTEPCNKFYD